MFYLKYRPQKISELDNTQIRETLGKTILADKWVHAYLLIGPRGTGKTTTARLIAKTVNCKKRQKGQEPCNKCDSCKEISAGISLDVIEIDAASNTGVDDIRDLREKIRLSPTSSRYKVYIIDEVHMLSTSAFNALLKTLEEPPVHAIFVLATTDPQKVPLTIVSRCMVYDFSKTPKDDIVGSLKRVISEERITVSEDLVAVIAERSAGSFRDAQKFLEQLVLQSAKPDLEHLDALIPHTPTVFSENILGMLANTNSQEAIATVEEYLAIGGKLKELHRTLVTRLRDILLFRNGIIDDVKDVKINDKEISRLVELFTNANLLMRDCPIPQLPLEMAILEFCQTGQQQEWEVGSAKLDTEVRGMKSSMSQDVSLQAPASHVAPPTSKIESKWPEILAAVKPYNHSLVALLRASRPKEIVNDTLTLEVFYKFHKERLEEKKNRDILEKVLSDIMGRTIRVKFVLADKKN